MYADDIVLLAENEADLQCIIDKLQSMQNIIYIFNNYLKIMCWSLCLADANQTGIRNRI